MTKPQLRAVKADEKAPNGKPLTIAEAAEKGSPRQQLVALRERIAKALDDPNCPSRDLASLSKRLIEITREIEAIDIREQEASEGASHTPDEAWEAV